MPMTPIDQRRSRSPRRSDGGTPLPKKLYLVPLCLTLVACGSSGGGGDTNGGTGSDPGPGTGPGNQAPSISGIPATTAVADLPYLFSPSAADPEGDTPTFSANNLPGWSSFDQTTGALSVTPTAGDAGSFQGLEVCVSDGEFTTCLPTFSIEVLVPTNSGSSCDIKLENGQIYLFDDVAAINIESTLTITSNRISYVGDASGAGNCAETIDLANRVVIPGLNDNHVHYFNRINAGGHVVAEIDTARSQADVIQRLQDAILIQTVPEVLGSVTVRNFLVTEGGNHAAALAEGSWPDLTALNAVDRPVFLVEGPLNGGVVNQAAKDFFEAAGRGGSIQANGNVGNPGDAAAYLLGLETTNDRKEDWMDGNRWAASVAMTAMQNFNGDPVNAFPEIRELYADGTAFLRFHVGVRDTASFLNSPVYAFSDMLRVTSIGEFHTGSTFSSPSSSYGDDAEAMALAGLTTHQHAINSAGDLEQYLALWEQAHTLFNIGILRWRLDHVFNITIGQMDRLRTLGGSVAIQGIGSATGNATAQNLRQVVDHARAIGMNVSGGTDGGNFYVINPWVAIHFFVTGEAENGGSSGMPAGGEVTVYEALHMYTIGSAYDTFDDDKFGSLEVGKFADLAVLADNPFAIEQSGNLGPLRNVSSVLTIVDGDIVYSNGLVDCNGSSTLWYRKAAGQSCTLN